MQCVIACRRAAVAVAIAALAAPVAMTAADSPLKSAREALAAGEPGRAVQILHPAVKARPKDAELQAELAIALLEAGAPNDALTAAFVASALAPAAPPTARALGLVRADRYEFDDALRAIDGAMAERPNEASLLAARGRVLWQLKRTRSAIDALTRAARDKSAAAEAQYWLGRIYFFKGYEAEGAFPGWHDEPEYRSQALAAFRAAAAANPVWYRPHLGLGEALLREEKPAEALAAFDTAIARGPNVTLARVARWRALKALGRQQEAEPQIAQAAGSSDPRLLDAARRGYALLGQAPNAQALEARILERFPDSAAAATILAERIDSARAAKQYAAVVEQGGAFVTRYPFSAQTLAVYDALLEAYQAAPSVPVDAVFQAVTAGIRRRPDPAPYFTGANLLLARQAMLDRAITLAEAGAPASQVFINENVGSYKMTDKANGSLARSRAASLDLVGWANFLGTKIDTAAAKLGEAERLSRGQDMANQFHLGELARAKGDLDRAREYYLSALTLAAGPPPLRQAATKSLADVYARLGHPPAEFDGYLKAELDRRRDERREQMLRSLVDRPAPELRVTEVSGRALDLAALRGKVVLLNFFASW